MASPTFLKYRRMLISGCVAAITMTGAWYGAGLKTRREIAVKTQEMRQASSSERIAQLESHRTTLELKKGALERKIGEIDGRMGRGS